MKIIFETLDEIFSDEAEDMFFGMGAYTSLPPMYTYVPSTKEVVDCGGIVIDKCETKEEFIKKYPEGVIW